MQNVKIKLKISKMTMVLQKNLHFSIGNFHFSMKFSVAFQNAKLIQIFQ